MKEQLWVSGTMDDMWGIEVVLEFAVTSICTQPGGKNGVANKYFCSPHLNPQSN